MFDFTPADDAFARVLTTRRTINDFRPESPPAEQVLQAIDVARWAPNHKMTEPWRFHLLGPQTSGQIIALSREVLTAEKGEEVARKKLERWSRIPGWIVVTCQRSPDLVRDQENAAAVSCAIQNLMLYLWSHEIGTKWSTSAVLQDPRLATLLGIEPQTERIVGLIWYGYPAQIPESRRRPVSDITIVHP